MPFSQKELEELRVLKDPNIQHHYSFRFLDILRKITRFSLKSIIVGIGIGIVLVGTYLYFNRPKPIDTKALTATFDYAETNDAGNIWFAYVLKNNTNQDYEIYSVDQTKIYAKLLRQSALKPSDKYVTFDAPVFIPANESIEFVINFANSYTYFSPYKANADAVGAKKEDIEAYRNDVAKYLKENIRNLDGFVILDAGHHYQIDFPAGWM